MCTYLEIPGLAGRRADRCLVHIPLEEKRHWGRDLVDNLQRAIVQLSTRARQSGVPVDLSGMDLPASVPIRLSEVPGLTWHSSTVEIQEVFLDCVFDGHVVIKDVYLPRGANFRGSEFRGTADIALRQSPGPVDFSDCLFRGDTRLGHFHVNGDVNLGGAQFHGTSTLVVGVDRTLSLDRTKFLGDMSVECDVAGSFSASHAVCESVARWTVRAARPTELSKLDHLRFGQGVTFQGSKFYGRLDCTGMVVAQSVRFDGVLFGAECDFGDSAFGGEAWFSGSGADGAGSFQTVSFANTKFGNKAVFTNRDLEAEADFSGCSFAMAPEFHGAKIHQAARFPHEKAFADVKSVGAAKAYRTLKLAMEQNRARHEEAMFFALEQRSLRNTPGEMNAWERTASWLYDKGAGYGQNFRRPFLALLVMWLVFALLYAWWGSADFVCGAPVDWHRVGRGGAFALEQVVNPFGVWRHSDAELASVVGSGTALKVVATFQSLLSAACAALFFLALRWRFKRE